MKKVAKAMHSEPPSYAPPKALDWLAPIIITIGLYFFHALSTMLFRTLQFGMPITVRPILSTLIGLAVLVLLFRLAPSPSAQQRRSGFTFLAGGLLLVIPQMLIGAYVGASSLGSRYEFFTDLIAAAYGTVTLGLVIVGWFVMRGYPRSSLAWLVPLPALVLATRLIFIGWVVPGLADGSYNPIQRILIDASPLFVQVGFVMFLATATMQIFQRAVLANGPIRNVPAIISFIFAFGLGAIAIATGHAALQQIDERNERGGGFAIAGITFGWATGLAALCLLLLAFGQAFRV